jgi:hypothetical protein
MSRRIAHNVLAVTDVWGRGRCVATTPAPNVAEKNRTRGASPTTVFRSPSRRKAAMQLQSCYVQFARILSSFNYFYPSHNSFDKFFTFK